jgi:hypothetical protein
MTTANPNASAGAAQPERPQRSLWHNSYPIRERQPDDLNDGEHVEPIPL